jgi:hypothetical protein
MDLLFFVMDTGCDVLTACVLLGVGVLSDNVTDDVQEIVRMCDSVCDDDASTVLDAPVGVTVLLNECGALTLDVAVGPEMVDVSEPDALCEALIVS